MSTSVLARMESERYFRLLSELVSGELEIALCDVDDLLLSSSKENSVFSHSRASTFITGDFEEISAGETSVFRLNLDDGQTLFRAQVTLPSMQRLGSLYALVPESSPPLSEHQEQLLAHGIGAIISLMEKECELESELDAMAEELTDRYEELNLVYDSEDEVKSFEHEGEALNNLVQHCLEHMNLEMVSLVLPGQDRIFCSTATDTSVVDPYETIRCLQPSLFPCLNFDNDSLIINEITDPRRKSLGIDIPYKLLACSVLDNQRASLGYLICFNPADGKDFFNSDKNLLHVIARKISKILQANYDPLTGLMNRRALESLVRRSLRLARDKGIFNCLLYIDLDQLEVVNQIYGREGGDYVIRTSGDLLQKNLRHTDSLGYLGDGRFGVLLEHCDKKQGARVAENLRKLVEQGDYNWAARDIDLSVTIGVSLIEPHSRDVDVVLEAAEIALRSAKEQGRNKIRVYHQDDRELAARKEQMYWVNRVQTALREDHFHLFAQTIQPVQNVEEKYHLEVLLRLIDEDGTVVSPFKFITAAEQYGLMPQVDRWVIDATFALLASKGFAATPGEGIVSINLSGQSLTDEGLFSFITSHLSQHNLHPSCICFEITETSAIHNLADAHQLLQDLKKLGCRLSLDDFGTGLSSFTYLQTLPVDTLKIDGSFVRHITTDKVSHAMVNSINQIGHVMELATVAEFVENDAIRVELEKIGVDYLQGYGIDEPSPLTAYLDSIREETRTGTGRL